LSSLKVFANIGTGIKSPQFAELFGGAGFDGNIDLQPERARSADVGADVTVADQRVRGTVTYFANRFRDMVEFRSTGFAEDGLPDFVNVAGAEASGWELEFTLQRPVAGFSARASYTFLDTEVTQTVSTGTQFQPGQPLLRRPTHSGVVRASYAAGAVTIHADAELRGERHDSSFLFLSAVPSGATTDITLTPGYAVGGLGVDVRVRDALTLFVRGSNVTDTAYETALGFPGLPRTFMAGARIGR
jgi:vitamin B12 transporter